MHYFKPPSPCNKDKGLINMAKITEYQTSKGKFYRFRVYAGIDEMTGKKKYIKRAGFKTKAEAKKELVKLEYDVSNGNYFKPLDSKLFKDVYLMWLDQYKITVKESTLNKVLSLFKNQILPQMGLYRVDKLNLANCQKAVNVWASSSPVSFKQLLGYASNVIDFARRLELTDRNPFKDVIRPRQKIIRSERNYFEPIELKRFLTIAKKMGLKNYAVLRMLAYSGMRIGELIALTWDDVDFVNNTISISKTVARGGNKAIIQSSKTSASKRLLVMDNETMQVLRCWQVKQASYLLKCGINAMSSKQLVFSNTKNEFLARCTVYAWVKKICAIDTSLPKITPHGFRHTHATLLLSAGASVKEVQTRLGHEKVQTTLDVYTHLTKQDQKATINKLVKYLG